MPEPGCNAGCAWQSQAGAGTLILIRCSHVVLKEAHYMVVIHGTNGRYVVFLAGAAR